METSKPENTNSSASNQPSKLKYYAIAGLILAVVAVYFFVDLQAKHDQTKRELETTYVQLDSMTQNLNDKIIEVSRLGGEIDTLMMIREQLEQEKDSIRRKSIQQSRYYRSQVTGLKDRVSGYKELLESQDKQIERLKQINEELYTENNVLKTETYNLNQSIKKLSSNMSEAEAKLAFASRLKLEGMQVSAITSKGKEKSNQFKNRHINQLKVEFTILENKIAPIEGKSILLKITGPDQNVIFDVANGSGTFVFDNREMFYTIKKDILYDRKNQTLTFMYKKGSEYKLGLHKIEVYTEEYLIGAGSFVVK